jgi:hypothetical protein
LSGSATDEPPNFITTVSKSTVGAYRPSWCDRLFERLLKIAVRLYARTATGEEST